MCEVGRPAAVVSIEHAVQTEVLVQLEVEAVVLLRVLLGAVTVPPVRLVRLVTDAWRRRFESKTWCV